MNALLEMLMQLFERAALLLICLFFITRIPRFKETLQKNSHSPAELAILTLIFARLRCLAPTPGLKSKVRLLTFES